MTNIDAQKLIRLRSDLGDKTSFIRELIGSFEADVTALRQTPAAPVDERADVVHQVTGSAAMLAPAQMVGRLNRLENALRNGLADETEFDTIATGLDALVDGLMEWVDLAPPDGEAIIAPQ